MPYIIRRSGTKFQIINKDTNKVVGTSDSREKAEASIRARLAGEHNPSWRPSGKKKKGKK